MTAQLSSHGEHCTCVKALVGTKPLCGMHLDVAVQRRMRVQLGAINKPTGYNATDSGLEDVNKLLKYSSQASCPASRMHTRTITSVISATGRSWLVSVASHMKQVWRL